MRNAEQTPSKRVRIVLCAAAFTFAAAVAPGSPPTGRRENQPTADWSSRGSSHRRLDIRQDQAGRHWTSKVKTNADWSSARIKPAADWTSQVKPNADWSS